MKYWAVISYSNPLYIYSKGALFRKLIKSAYSLFSMMKLKDKILKIFLNTIPVILMIALIPVFKNDYILTGIYALIIAVSFAIKYEQKDYLFFIFGLIIMIIFEYFFVSTGIETFVRNSLFGLMPLWLPVLWAYGFVAMKRAIIILDK